MKSSKRKIEQRMARFEQVCRDWMLANIAYPILLNIYIYRAALFVEVTCITYGVHLDSAL